jgi:hypothetical protein
VAAAANNPDPAPDEAGAVDPPAPEEGGDREGELRRETIRYRREARAAQQATDELRAQLERIRVEHESAQDKAIREAVEQAEQRKDAEYAGERLHNRLRVRAANRLRDPEDAVLHLGGTLPPDADDKTVDDALEQLIKDRDYLANPSLILPAGGNGDSLVTQGPRSTAPGRAVRESTPDEWIRSRARHGRG